jgi:ELWxxDGT repeat protein
MTEEGIVKVDLRAARRCGRAGYHVEALERRTLLSGAILIKDINPGTVDSQPQPMGRLGTTEFFAANDGLHGRELFKTDGTPAGTVMVSDIIAGPADSLSFKAAGAAFNGQFYFGASFISSVNSELFRTDGTTVFFPQLLNHVSGGTPQNFTPAGTNLFFTAPTDSSGGRSVVWVTSATASPVPLGNVAPAVASLVPDKLLSFGNKLYFLAHDTTFTATSEYLYVSDGTATGTTLLKSGLNTGDLSLVSMGTKVYFMTGNGSADTLWGTDGTAGNTTAVKSLTTASGLVSGAGTMYFFAQDTSTAFKALWKSDGTAANTTVVTAGLSLTRPGIGLSSSGSVFFFAEDSARINSLYTSNGTAGGTAPLVGLQGQADIPNTFAAAGSFVVFMGYDAAHGFQLWESDGTVANTKILTINPNGPSSNPSLFDGSGSPVYFSATDGTFGTELWKTDGSQAGTKLVGDVNTLAASSSPHGTAFINGKLYFAATEAHGTQPWFSDTTAGGTAMLADIDPVAQFTDPRGFIGANGKVFFGSSTTSWMSNGTSAGTIPLANAGGLPTNIQNLTAYNNAAYFSGFDPTNGNELWKSDGTQAGTVQVNGGATWSSPTNLIAVNSTLFIEAWNGTNYEVFAGNGTAAGTTQLTSFTGLSGILSNGAIFNGKLYFVVAGTGIGTQLWVSNGTAAGTTLVKQLSTSTSGGQIAITANSIFATAHDPTNSSITALFKSDGTAGGTSLVTNLPSGVSVYAPVGSGNKLFFQGYPSASGSYFTLWVSDGTAGGTFPFTLRASGNPNLGPMIDVNGVLYFSADDGTHGQELWRSDGTVSGTFLFQDINPGPGSSNPGGLLRVGGTLYLGADDGIHGNELMQMFVQDSVTGTAAADTLTLKQNSDHAHIDWTLGTTTGQFPINDPAGFTLTGNGGNDVITLDYANGNPLPNTLHLNGTFTINGLSNSNPLAGTKMEIGQGTLYVSYAGSSPASFIRQALAAGYGGGAWNGAAGASGAITSIAAAGGAAGVYGIGYVDSADGVVAGQPVNTVEVRYTVMGDANLDRVVNSTDAIQMARNYLVAGKSAWDLGNFNYDATIDYSDALILQKNFNAVATGSVVAATTASAVNAGAGVSGGGTVTPVASDPGTTVGGGGDLMGGIAQGPVQKAKRHGREVKRR